MNKIEKITESDIAATIDAHKLYNSTASKITDRMDYIIRRCLEIAGGKLDWWDWNCDGDYEDQSSGDFMESYDKDTLTIRAEWNVKRDIAFIDKDGNEWGLSDGVPTRWLYEDFEEEFTNGLKAYKEKEQARVESRKEVAKKKKEQKEELLAAAKSNGWYLALTPAQKKLLGIK